MPLNVVPANNSLPIFLMPPLLHIHETCLYAEDLAAMERSLGRG